MILRNVGLHIKERRKNVNLAAVEAQVTTLLETI